MQPGEQSSSEIFNTVIIIKLILKENTMNLYVIYVANCLVGVGRENLLYIVINRSVQTF